MSGLLRAILSLWRQLVRTFGPLWELAAELFRAFFLRREKKTKLKPWLVVRRGKGRPGSEVAAPRDDDMARLMERMHNLDDSANLSRSAVTFAGQGADYFARPEEVEEIMRALLRENPPFLHIARDRPAEGEGQERRNTTEYLLRDSDVVVSDPCRLFIPQTGVEHRESSRPPGYPLLRSAKSLSDLRHAPLLYQMLPDDLVVARLLDGSIPIMAYHEERKTLLFKPEDRIIERRERRRNYVPVEIEGGGAAQSTRLMYMLFDRSTSLVHNCVPRGINAVMETAIAAAMIRSDMGRPYARYYFRSFADKLDPLPQDAPFSASTLEEKDRLVRRLFRINFAGEATRVVDALGVAADDIERIVSTGELGQDVKPHIGLLTDGRSTIYGSIGVRLKKMGVELDTILIGPDAVYNQDLIRMSSSVCMVDPALYRPARAA